MNIEQAYLTYLQLVNRSFTNDNVDVDRSRFIIAYNYTEKKFIEWTLDKRNEDDIRDIQELLVLDKKLIKSTDVVNHSNFKLPADYFNHSSLQVFGSKGSCKNAKIFSFEVKNDDVEEYLADVFNQPSFEYRESFYTINNSEISIYFDNFKIDDAFLAYYRYPKEVDIQGYIKLDGSNSTNIDPELSDRVVERILLAMSKEYSAINDDLNRYQVDKDRLFSKI